MYHLGELSTDDFLNIASILKISKPVLGNFHLFFKRTIFLTVFCKVIITIIITPVSEEYGEFTTRIYFAHIPVNSLLFLVYCNFDVVQNCRSTQGSMSFVTNNRPIITIINRSCINKREKLTYHSYRRNFVWPKWFLYTQAWETQPTIQRAHVITHKKYFSFWKQLFTQFFSRSSSERRRLQLFTVSGWRYASASA